MKDKTHSVEDLKKDSKQQSLLKHGLGRKILLWFLAISLIPLVATGVFNYLSIQRSLLRDIDESLSVVTEIKTRYINSYFDRIQIELLGQAKLLANKKFLSTLIKEHQSNEKATRDFVKSHEWESIVRDNAGDVKSFCKLYGFYDVLLIDIDGNVLFSIMQEDDLGANLFKGMYSDSYLASACRRSLETVQPIFSDFEFYSPSGGDVSAFFVAPVINKDESIIGLIALQVPIGQIDEIMQINKGLKETGESYLIGVDLCMRSNSSRADKPTILEKLVDTEQTRGWLREHSSTSRALVCNKENPFCYLGYKGKLVLGSHKALEISGTRMGVIVEIEKEEALAPVIRQRNISLAIGLAVLIVVFAGAIRASKSIVNPIQALREGTEIVGSGDFNHRVGTNANDEIGQLSRSFDDMVDMLKTVTASRDDLNKEVIQRKQTEKKLESTLNNLERSNKDLEQFAYSASHDLQEPLRKVLAFGSLLSSEYGDKIEGDGSIYVKTMKNAAERMQSLINALLDYARVTTRAKTLVPVDLNEVADGVISDLEISIRETHAKVDISDLPKIEADPTQMRQLLQNLIGNALKFHKKDETPHIQVHAEVESDRPSNEKNRTEVMHILVFEDNGIGLDEKFAERIFNPFQRLNGLQKFSGSGIGLAVCRRIVERHRGTITVKSELGAGAKFIVRLPEKQIKGEDAIKG